MNAPSPDLSVVIPVFREADCIEKTLSEIAEHFDGAALDLETVVADDGSDDGTAEVAEKAAESDERVKVVRLDVHRGKGAAVRQGILASRGRLVLVTDADLSIPLSQYAGLRDALESGADIAIGSKELGRRNGFVVQPFLRTLMGRVFNLAVRALVIRGVLDTQAGFKLLRGDAARALAARCVLDGFACDVELLARAQRGGLTIREVPVHCRRSSSTSVRLVADSIAMVRDLFTVRRIMRREAGER